MSATGWPAGTKTHPKGNEGHPHSTMRPSPALTVYLPGGQKYTGAMYAGREHLAGPVKASSRKANPQPKPAPATVAQVEPQQLELDLMQGIIDALREQNRLLKAQLTMTRQIGRIAISA